jgi:hypothetical protein
MMSMMVIMMMTVSAYHLGLDRRRRHRRGALLAQVARRVLHPLCGHETGVTVRSVRVGSYRQLSSSIVNQSRGGPRVLHPLCGHGTGVTVRLARVGSCWHFAGLRFKKPAERMGIAYSCC